jgi:hypothetical protein
MAYNFVMFFRPERRFGLTKLVIMVLLKSAMQNADATQSNIKIVFDSDAALRRRRQVALPESTIARAIKAARKHGGPNWRIAIEGDVIHLFEGESPSTAPSAMMQQNDKVASEKTWRL